MPVKLNATVAEMSLTRTSYKKAGYESHRRALLADDLTQWKADAVGRV
jgi:hypothetical protein